MFPIQQQLAAAARIQYEAQLGLYRDFSETALESVEKLAHLNLAAARASLEEAAATARQVLGAEGPQQVVSLLRAQTGPTLGKAVAYGNHVINIATNAQTEMTRAAEVHVVRSSRQVSELVDEAARNAPPGAENMLTLMKAAIGSASSGYEQVNRSTRKAVEALESNVNAAVNQIVQPAPQQPAAG